MTSSRIIEDTLRDEKDALVYLLHEIDQSTAGLSR